MGVGEQHEADLRGIEREGLVIERPHGLVALKQAAIDKAGHLVCLDHGTGAGHHAGGTEEGKSTQGEPHCWTGFLPEGRARPVRTSCLSHMAKGVQAGDQGSAVDPVPLALMETKNVDRQPSLCKCVSGECSPGSGQDQAM